MGSLQAQVDAVRIAVASSTTCTPATVVSLKSLLLTRDIESQLQPTSTRAKIARGDTATTSRPPTATSSRPGTAAALRRPTTTEAARTGTRQQPDAQPGLSDKEKAQLATHVINAVLKALAEAAKPTSGEATVLPKTSEREEPACDGTAAASPMSTARGALRRSISAPMSPLQPRILNRVSTSPIKTSSKHSAVTAHAASNSQLLAIVECARIAFATLRTLQDFEAMSLPELQLEAGMSSFVTKLLSLNMLDQACRELHVLKERLQEPAISASTAAATSASAETSKTTKTARTTKAKAPTQKTIPKEAPTLSHISLTVGLLDYGNISAASLPTLKLIIASQLQALRILAALKRPAQIDTALPYLRYECKSSPIQLLSICFKAASGNAAEKQKLLRQLETLSQVLLALAPSVSSKDDSSAIEPKLSISPLAALELQTLSLETKLRCWILAGSQNRADADKDILAPFSRCLTTYVRRCRSSSTALSYKPCRVFFDRIIELIQGGHLSITITSKSPTASIYQTLSAVARESGNIEEAIHWASKLFANMNPDVDSAARCCSTSAQLLSLQLKNPAQKYAQDCQALLTNFVESIKGSLKGDTAELEDLLASVCMARKAAVNLLVSHTRYNSNSSTKSIPTKRRPFELLLESFIYQCPRFCLRWLGKPPAAKSSTKDFLRYEQRRHLLTQSIRHTLDSALIVTKAMIEGDRMIWEQLDSVLSDSLTLLDYLGDLKTADSSSSYHVKISHFYYLSYNALRQKGGDTTERDALKALRRAIDCIKHRPRPEREKAQLLLKLERMADLARSTGQIGEALGALQSIRTNLVDDGVLATVTAALNQVSPSLAWTAAEQTRSLSRTLVSIHRLEQVHMNWSTALEELEQAAVLEHQLHFIKSDYSNGGSGSSKPSRPFDAHDPFRSCVEELLRIYYPTRFPVRRLRTLLRSLSANIDKPEIVAEITPQVTAVLGLIDSKGLADDSSLACYLPYYKSMAISLVGFNDGYADSGALQNCLSAWKSILEANHSLPELELAVDNISEFQTHLHSISEFMRAMGRDTVITPILELSQSLSSILGGSIVSLSNPVHHPVLALSSHYLRMGDCAKAEKMLEELRGQLDGSDVALAAATISFHLTYAECLITAGRFDEAEHFLQKAEPANFEGMTSAQGLVRVNGSQKRRLGAQACFLQSHVALEKGDHSIALQNARNGVRLLFQDWSRMEKAMEQPLLSANSPLVNEDDSSADMTSSSFSEQSSSVRASRETSLATMPDTSGILTVPGPTAVASPIFWALFHPLFNSMLGLSSIYAYLGMFQETLYYAEQAHKIAMVTSAALSLAQAECWLATVCLKASQNGTAATYLATARSRLSGMDQTHRKSSLVCELASLYRELGDYQSEQDLLLEAEQIAQRTCASSSTEKAVDNLAKAESIEEEKGRATVGRRIKAAAATSAKTLTTSATATRRAATIAKAAAKTVKPVDKTKTAAARTSEMASIITNAPTCVANESPSENLAVVDFHAALSMQKALSHMSKRNWAKALTILRGKAGEDSGSNTSKKLAEILAGHIALAACLLGHSTEQMAGDAVFSVIQDSALSFPAVSGGLFAKSSEGTDRVSYPKSPLAVKARGMASALGKAAKDAASFVEMLQEAQDCLIEAQSLATVAGDSVTLNRISSMLQSAVIVLSATSWSKPRVLGHPSYASCSVELARNMTWKRERRAVLVEKAMMKKQDTSCGNTLWWPAVPPSTMPAAVTMTPNASLNKTPRRPSMTEDLADFASMSKLADVNIGRFQRDYIDIIPKDWSVVSMALSENKHNLCITKLQAGQSPFVIRLPLERAMSHDADNEVFNYQQGRAELLEIVQSINESCHDARDMTVKGAKSSWWTEREALDNRLKELLDNVEQIWLRGFRGIFSQHVRRPALFARFQKTFEGILNKHLPSRRSPAARGTKRRGGNAAASCPSSCTMKVALDSRVLDLFIGLGDATDEGCDFDDALDDLLYFVVDILQFHGERNAYDEIDFDAMVVETFDALFAYHTAVNGSQARSSATAVGEPNDHLHSILVLDKSLHVFPWEALPCMRRLAVSRVPSLACLRSLIINQQQQLQQQQDTSDFDELREQGAPVDLSRPSGYRASLASGAYMLNPSGDLPSTETTFDGPLTSSLRGPQWTRMVGRTPTEDEFENILRDKDVLLYFGHGSGAQYIRGRTVRKLERCRATALLMGCSSAGLNYNGEFELHGPVWDYMLAGCPAVVGTLWDVTDKDIDRFAGQVFEEWGLVPRGTFDDSKSSKRSCSTRATASLVEAVARARDAPRFRYLTAAAVCVYGIPVYLQ